MLVVERLVRLRRVIVLRNVLKPSEKVLLPSVGDVDSPHCDSRTSKAEQHHHVMQAHCHLANGKME
jgi:hypothetical protein